MTKLSQLRRTRMAIERQGVVQAPPSAWRVPLAKLSIRALCTIAQAPKDNDKTRVSRAPVVVVQNTSFAIDQSDPSRDKALHVSKSPAMKMVGRLAR